MKTQKGTELPLLNLKGKDYLEVKYRLVWFREEHPDWGIETEVIRLENNACIGKATVKDATGRVLATSHKYEDSQGFSDYIEKSETGAIGRALALIGYGTQFAPELDEGERIVDSPVQKVAPLRQGAVNAQPPAAPTCESCYLVLKAGPHGLYCPNYKDKTKVHTQIKSEGPKTAAPAKKWTPPPDATPPFDPSRKVESLKPTEDFFDQKTMNEEEIPF